MATRHNGPLGEVVCGLGAATLLLAAVGIAPAEAAAKKPRPDLVINSGRLDTIPGAEQEVGFIAGHGGTTQFKWRQKTKNAGQTASPPSMTGVQIVIDSKHVITADKAKISRLQPGVSEATHGRFKEYWDATWDYGTYPTRICADVTRKVSESKEGKNCRATHTIWVVPLGFTGTLNGQAVQPSVKPGVTLSWEFPAGVTFALAPNSNQPFAGNGILLYAYVPHEPESYDLRYTISGTNTFDGCTWSGTGGYEPATEFHYMRVSFGRPSGLASAQILVDRGLPQFKFSATVSCPGGSVSQVDVIPSEWGRAAFWFDTGPTAGRFPDPGLTRLKGDYTDTNATYHWDFTPIDHQP